MHVAWLSRFKLNRTKKKPNGWEHEDKITYRLRRSGCYRRDRLTRTEPWRKLGSSDADGPTIARPNVRALATTASFLIMRTMEALRATIEVWPGAREKTLARG